jgi:hypothetical protein
MLARIENNAIAEQRDLLLEHVPEHKRGAWLPIEGDPPAYDSRIATRTGPTYTIEPTRVLRQWTVTPRDLAAVKAEFAKMVDDAAEACRLRYITPGAGMAMTYQEKFAQAQAVAAMGEAAANAMSAADREEQFPTLSASVGLEAPTLWDCAQRVLAAYAAFAQLSLVIERTRLAGKASISAASDGAAVVAAYEALTWPMP